MAKSERFVDKGEGKGLHTLCTYTISRRLFAEGTSYDKNELLFVKNREKMVNSQKLNL